MPDWFNVLIPTLLGAGGGSGAVLLIRVKSDVRKTDADAAQTLSAAAVELLEPFRQEVTNLRAKMGELQTNLDAREEQVNRLDRLLKGAMADVTELREANTRYRDLFGPLPS